MDSHSKSQLREDDQKGKPSIAGEEYWNGACVQLRCRHDHRQGEDSWVERGAELKVRRLVWGD